MLRKYNIWQQWVKTHRWCSIQLFLLLFYFFYSFFLFLFLAIWDWFSNASSFPLLSHITQKSTPKTPCHSKSFWRALTSMKEEKIEDISGALHGENFGISAFSSLQTPQRSRLLQVCSPQPALWWKPAAFNCRCTLFNSLSCLPWHTSPHNDYREKKSLPLFTPPLHLKKIQTRKLQNIWGTHEVVTALAPPTDLDKQLHTDS